jgi:hypothetical protein
MKIEALSLKHGPMLQEKLGPLGDGLSEYCFSNLYLFRKVHKYKVILDREIFISGTTYDGSSHLMPVFNPADVDKNYIADVLKGFDCLYPVSDKALKNIDSKIFSTSFNDDDTDYVYSAEKLKTYRGRKLGRKRNLMKQFLENFTVETFPACTQRKKDIKDILDQWLKDVGHTAAQTDYYSCLEAFTNMDILGLFGFVYYVQNGYAQKEPAGFVLAKEVSPGICVIHFAKGKRKYKGIYQFMFNQFANTYSGRFNYYNFEQDLGNPNFRKTKLSYSPDQMLRKYRVRLRDPDRY